MTGTFALATVSNGGVWPYVALVLDGTAIALEVVGRHAPRTPRLDASSMLALLENWDASFEEIAKVVEFLAREGIDNAKWRDAVTPIERLRVHAPIPRPPGMFFAAVNYPRPAGRNAPPPEGVKRRPHIFEKTARCAIGPYDDIVKPREFAEIDWEVELAVVIGRAGARIPAAKAMDHVAGYMIANDVTCRDFRKQGELAIPGPDWFGTKCHDGFSPLGPYFVPKPFVRDARNLRLTLKVNGETRQDGNTKDMIFSPEEQIEQVARHLTLEPGDVFSTGTPEGIAMLTGARYLQVGDVMETEIEGLGVQRNKLVAAA
jgi:2-keto-4-pentenoate hydratase/2-oxohepta-3-ene-1,7-dioic acid hydratase in catechol pathway